MNANELLRQYLPIGTDLRQVDESGISLGYGQDKFQVKEVFRFETASRHI